jgi:hypothetical protein
MCEWFSFKFNISWDRSQKPKTWIDIFIIDTIVREVISHNESKIVLWRIHRRWPDDEVGHELTFDCRTNKETTDAIETIINNNAYFKMLQDGYLLNKKLEIVTEDITKDIAHWPPPLQKSWPYYINGCCEMFLRLIENIRGSENIPTDIHSAEQLYKKINNQLTEIWQRHGNNAFCHHINAVFGYESSIAAIFGQFLNRI